MERLLSCEAKMIACRQELNTLMKEYYEQRQVPDSTYERKLSELRREMNALGVELENFRHAVAAQQSPVSEQQPFMQPQSFMQPAQPFTQPAPASTPQQPFMQSQPFTQPAPASMPAQLFMQQAPVREGSLKKAAEKKDWELIMGKSLMGIFASVLIFISLVLFATLILPGLSDGVKMALMYLVSFVFLGTGLFFLHKDRSSKLYISLASCGLGAVYISLLVSNLYFKAVSDVLLFVLLFVWAVLVFWLARGHSWIFQAIGQTGIFISVIFGTVLCANTGDWYKFLFLTLYFVITESLFVLGNMQKLYQKNGINLIGILLGLFVLRCADFAGYYLDMNVLQGISYTLLTLFSLAMIAVSFVCFLVQERYSVLFAFLQALFLLSSGLFYIFAYGEVVFIVLSLAMLAALEWKFKGEKSSGAAVLQTILFGVILFCSYQPIFYKEMHEYYLQKFHMGLTDVLYGLYSYISLAAFAAVFFWYGYCKKRRIWQVAGSVYLGFFVLDFLMNRYANLVLGLLLFSLWGCLLKKKQQYNTVAKISAYLLFLVFVLKDSIWILQGAFTDLHSDVKALIVFTLLCGAHFAATQTSFVKNWETGETEKEMDIAGGILHGILMIAALGLIVQMELEVCHFLSILIALLLFAINSGKLFRLGSKAAEVYVGGKFTLLLYIILSSYEAAAFVSSISFFVLAIVCIAGGFLFSRKPLRIYGLVISLLSAAKLVLVDISYGNTAGRALSFFICGLLCFSISIIYHYVDKKFTGKKGGQM